jgi:dolichol kinase
VHGCRKESGESPQDKRSYAKEKSMKRSFSIFLTVLVCCIVSVAAVKPAMAEPVLKQIGEFVISEANQGVGVDDKYFYAVDNQTIAKYDKKTGALILIDGRERKMVP